MSHNPVASPRSACPRTMRVVSTPLRGAEPTVLGDGVQVDHENATYVFSQPIGCAASNRRPVTLSTKCFGVQKENNKNRRP